MSRQILRYHHVSERTGLSRSTIYNRLNPKNKGYDPSFPKPRDLGPRLRGFDSDEVDQWIAKTLF